MVLESTVICLDNSDWMRNGDYLPTRLEAQQDAASMICGSRIESNAENTVGLLSMAGKGVDMLVSPTEDIGKILAAFSTISSGGQSDFCNAVQIAQLALKHRKNKKGGQRIIAFVGSPLIEDKKTLQKVGKQLKKNNVAIDIISLGELEENQEKLLELVNATNSGDNSHLITVPPGVLPSDALLESPIMRGEGGIGMSTGGGGVQTSGGGGGFEEYGGVDPSLDPELAMAIRVSTEEARAREEARVSSAAAVGGAGTPAESSADTGDATSLPPLSQLQLNTDDDEDSLLQRALELSMLSSMPSAAPRTATSTAPTEPLSENSVAMNEDDEEEALRRAMELSMQDCESIPQPTATAPAPPAVDPAAAFLDPSFVSRLLGSVDVDQNDPLIQAALAQINAASSSTTTQPGQEEGGGKESKKRKDGPSGDSA